MRFIAQYNKFTLSITFGFTC